MAAGAAEVTIVRQSLMFGDGSGSSLMLSMSRMIMWGTDGGHERVFTMDTRFMSTKDLQRSRRALANSAESKRRHLACLQAACLSMTASPPTIQQHGGIASHDGLPGVVSHRHTAAKAPENGSGETDPSCRMPSRFFPVSAILGNHLRPTQIKF